MRIANVVIALVVTLLAGAIAFAIEPPRSSSSMVAVMADGTVAVIGSRSPQLVLSSAARTAPVWTVPFDYRPIQIAALGKSIVVVGASKSSGRYALWLVDPNGKATPRPLPVKLPTDIVTTIAGSPDGRSLYVVVSNNEILRFDADLSRLIDRRPLYEFRAGAVAVAATDVIAAADTERGGIRLYDTHGRLLKSLSLENPFVASLAFAPGGRSVYAASGVQAGYSEIDVSSGKVRSVRTGSSVPSAIAPAADGSVWVVERSGLVLERYSRAGVSVERRELAGKQAASLPRKSSVRAQP
jgi:WD40 repeat protein